MAGKVISTLSFSLSPIEADGSGTKGHRKIRHLRQIEDIKCTSDGSYAIVLCSDNTVLMYSICDVLGRGEEPVRREGTASVIGNGGFLALWFQLFEENKVEVNISHILNAAGKAKACGCGTGYKHAAAADVMVTVASWSLRDNTGVLRSWRIASTPMPSTSMSTSMSSSSMTSYKNITAANTNTNRAVFTPWYMCTAGVGVVSPDYVATATEQYCRVCFDGVIPHWTDDLPIDDSTSTSSTNKIATTDTKKREPLKRKSNDLIHGDCDSQRCLQNENTIQQLTTKHRRLEDKLDSMETELRIARSDLEVTIRKADRRFEQEKISRRGWKIEKDILTYELDEAKRELQLERMRREDETRVKHRIEQQLLQVRSLLGLPASDSSSSELISSTDPTVTTTFTTTSTSSLASPSASAQSPSHGLKISAPFCVICQANTADTMVLNCGHICLCSDHARHMTVNRQLDHCPLCKEACIGICRVQGLLG
eukprot:gene7524-15407_t